MAETSMVKQLTEKFNEFFLKKIIIIIVCLLVQCSMFIPICVISRRISSDDPKIISRFLYIFTLTACEKWRTHTLFCCRVRWKLHKRNIFSHKSSSSSCVEKKRERTTEHYDWKSTTRLDSWSTNRLMFSPKLKVCKTKGISHFIDYFFAVLTLYPAPIRHSQYFSFKWIELHRWYRDG